MTIPNFKLFLNQNYNGSSFYIKAVEVFQDNARFSIFEHPHKPQFKTKLTFITYKINHLKQKLSYEDKIDF